MLAKFTDPPYMILYSLVLRTSFCIYLCISLITFIEAETPVPMAQMGSYAIIKLRMNNEYVFQYKDAYKNHIQYDKRYSIAYKIT